MQGKTYPSRQAWGSQCGASVHQGRLQTIGAKRKYERRKATGQIEPKPVKIFNAKALGRLGGLKGGKARAARLTPARRVEIAKKAAMARWGRRT